MVVISVGGAWRRKKSAPVGGSHSSAHRDITAVWSGASSVGRYCRLLVWWMEDAALPPALLAYLVTTPWVPRDNSLRTSWLLFYVPRDICQSSVYKDNSVKVLVLEQLRSATVHGERSRGMFAPKKGAAGTKPNDCQTICWQVPYGLTSCDGTWKTWWLVAECELSAVVQIFSYIACKTQEHLRACLDFSFFFFYVWYF